MNQVNGLIPMIHVKSMTKSINFYQRLGFSVGHTFKPPGQAEPVWAMLESASARLMLALAGEPIDPKKQAILFYLYCDDAASLRTHLISEGLKVGELEVLPHSPKGEFRTTDPDGYALIVRYP